MNDEFTVEDAKDQIDEMIDSPGTGLQGDEGDELLSVFLTTAWPGYASEDCQNN